MNRLGPGYWIPTIALLGFGVLAILSVGLPFLVVGLLLAVGGAVGAPTRRPSTFWSVVAAVAGLVVGHLAVAPFGCSVSEAVVESSTTDSTAEGAPLGTTRCTSLTGISYTGDAGYEPPRWPGIAAGGGLAIVAGAITRRTLSRPGRRRPDTGAGRDVSSSP